MKRIITSCLSLVLLTALCHAEQDDNTNIQASVSQQEESENLQRDFTLLGIALQWPGFSEQDKQQYMQAIQQQFPDVTRIEIDFTAKALTLKKQIKHSYIQILEEAAKELSAEQQEQLAIAKKTAVAHAKLDQKIQVKQKIEEQIKNEWNKYNGDASKQAQHRANLFTQLKAAASQVQSAERYIRHKSRELNECAMYNHSLMLQQFAQDTFPNPVTQEEDSHPLATETSAL